MFPKKICCFPSISTPSDFQLKKQLQWVLFLRVVVLTILLGITMLLQTSKHDIIIPSPGHVAFFIIGTYLFTILSAFILNVITCYRRFAYLQIITDCLLTTILIVITGSSQSIFTIIYFFPIISSAIILYRQGALLLASIATFCNGAILYAEYYGITVPLLHDGESALTSIQVVLHYFAIRGLTFFLVGLLSAILSERLLRAETELSRTSQNLDRLALLYKQIFDDIATGIITVDTQGIITSFNRSAGVITGYNALDVLGQKIASKFPELSTLKTDLIRPMAILIKKDGSKIPVGYSWTRLNMPGDCENCRVYTMQDLTIIKKMEEKVRQSEKMAAIGELAAGVAHEFRNPLAAISGASQVLEQEFSKNTPNYSLINIIVRECNRLDGTVSDFLHFSKPATPEKNWLSLGNVVNETLDILKQGRNWNDKITVETHIPENQDCWADSGQLIRIILNLLENAGNFIDENHGVITITASEINEENQEKTLLQISDNGPGIDPSITKQLFEPFFTTRENGTGLGLAIVKQLVESHGGVIWAENDATGGAIFSFTLPLP